MLLENAREEYVVELSKARLVDRQGTYDTFWSMSTVKLGG